MTRTVRESLIIDKTGRKQINEKSILIDPPKEEMQIICIAKNEFGKVEKKMIAVTRDFFIENLKINSPDKLELLRSEGQLDQWDDQILSCQADGYPAPEIEWSREVNGAKFPLSDRSKQWNNGTLTISDIQPLDSGVYICQAVNPAGVLIKKMTLNIIEAPSLRPVFKFLPETPFLIG